MRLRLCPAKASSQIPLVAPRFVPKIIDKLPARPIMPLLKKAMVSNDTRVLDCKIKVALMPKTKPLIGLWVDFAMSRSRVPPVACCKPSSILHLKQKQRQAIA